MALIKRVTGYVTSRRWLEVSLLLALVLAYTLPFINQAVHVDAQLDIDWAEQQLEHPLWHHIPDYDYFGFHYDEFHDTHPRLQSTYLSLILRLNGGQASETLLHLAMIPFPLIAAVSMYALARRFRVNAFLASLLLLVSPAFLVNTHLIMKDIPGISLWLAGLALFITGVDRDRFRWMAAGGVVLTMSAFIFYQGLSALPLALLYIILQRKVARKPIIALSIPVAAFIAFVSAHLAYYSAFPTYKYPPPVGLPIGLKPVLLRLRGVLTMIGGTTLLPVVGVWLFTRTRFSAYLAAGAYIVSTVWISIRYVLGDAPVEHLVLVPLFLSSGVVIVWWFLARSYSVLWPRLRGLADADGRDDLFLGAWFLGVWVYCSLLLPYASPRFLIPLIPPLAIVTARIMATRWRADRSVMFRNASLIVSGTLVLALAVAVGEHHRADYGREQARWVADNIDTSGRTVWYGGYLGFQYYLEQYGDFNMLIMNESKPKKGDVIVETVYNGRWLFPEELKDRIEVRQVVDFERIWPVITYYDQKISWIGVQGGLSPYGFSGDFVERIYVYDVVADPVDYAARAAAFVEWRGWRPPRLEQDPC